MAKYAPSLQPAWGQAGLEWLPKNSEGRKLKWTSRQQPVRLTSRSFTNPLSFRQCFNCFEEALWYCVCCKMQYCRFDDCKIIHEYEHSLSRLAGPDDKRSGSVS